MRFHGVLLEVGGSGVLLAGPSGSGKSECALDLIARGHRFVADDVVDLERRGERVWGRACAELGSHVQIRGLGILSVAELYGREAIAAEAAVDLLCRLGPAPEAPEATGLESEWETLCGVAVRRVVLVPPRAASLATLVDAAVRDQRVRAGGPSAADRFQRAWLARTRPPS